MSLTLPNYVKGTKEIKIVDNIEYEQAYFSVIPDKSAIPFELNMLDNSFDPNGEFTHYIPPYSTYESKYRFLIVIETPGVNSITLTQIATTTTNTIGIRIDGVKPPLGGATISYIKSGKFQLFFTISADYDIIDTIGEHFQSKKEKHVGTIRIKIHKLNKEMKKNKLGNNKITANYNPQIQLPNEVTPTPKKDIKCSK